MIIEKIMRVMVTVEVEETDDPITEDDWRKLGHWIDNEQARTSDGWIGRIEFIEWEEEP